MRSPRSRHRPITSTSSKAALPEESPFPVGFAYLDLERTGTIAHLWVVCAQPGSDPDERVIISITSDGEHIKDRSCEVAEGDHDFIKHRSYVLFRKAAIVTVGDLSAWKARGNLVIKTDMSAAVVDRIRHAALRSIYVSNDVKDCIDDCSWRPPAKS